MRPVTYRLLAFVVCASPQLLCAENAKDAKRFDFFEKRIRPVLVKHCYECHSAQAKQVRGKLLLDSREGIRKGGESGPAVVPGDVKKSLLIDAIRYESLEMPPKQRLAKEVVADFASWIKAGAPDPRAAKSHPLKRAGRTIDMQQARRFWAFQSPQRHRPPRVNDATWPRNDIDRFILKKLESAGLTPAPDADRRTLIRRVTYDLTGLPPTPQDVRAFLDDKSATAFAKVVDRLLASPQFGEHWGRHWLDVARYADSNGGDINLTFRNAWRYRDYVVRSFNDDKPFDRFITEQIAGDLLDSSLSRDRKLSRDAETSQGSAAEHNADRLVATGFLIVGSKMLSERDKEKLRMDVVDEQLDTIGRAFLGLTIGCARCHDHKFDPIPTRDYYALAGILRSTITVQGIRMNNVNVSGWIERELPMPAKQRAALAEHQRKSAALLKQIAALERKLGVSIGGGIVAANTLPGIVVDDVQAKKVGTWKKSSYTKRYVGAGYVHDDKKGKGEKSITFTPDIPAAGRYEVRLSYTGGNGRAANVPITIKHANGETKQSLNQRKQPKFNRLFHSLGTFQFKADRKGSVTIINAGTTGHVIADAVQFLPIGNDPRDFPKARESTSPSKREFQTQLAKLQSQITNLKKNAPRPAPMCMAPQDVDKPADCRVRIRGEAHNRGKIAPRGFLSVVPFQGPAVGKSQSGRRELAAWIASEKNPLTARVAVNRIWHHLFGAGIVRTVDNFGKLGERPSHPQLLDRLAVEFVTDNWSIQRAIRRIILSRTYRMSTQHSERGIAADPRNRLLWRHNRRRLNAEAIRDSVLAVSGRLDRAVGGSAVKGFGEQAVANNLKHKGGGENHSRSRRSLYLPLVRNDLPKMLTVFDFADPNVTTGARSVTTVPAQALLMMNSEFVKTHAGKLAERILRESVPSNEARLNRLYELTLGRLPTEKERRRAVKYVGRFRKTGTDSVLIGWTNYSHALLASTEFRFLE